MVRVTIVTASLNNVNHNIAHHLCNGGRKETNMKYVYKLEMTSEMKEKVEHLSLRNNIFSSKKKCLYELECQRAWHIQNADKFCIKDVSAISEVEFYEVEEEPAKREKKGQWVYKWVVTFLGGNKKSFYGYITQRIVY